MHSATEQQREEFEMVVEEDKEHSPPRVAARFTPVSERLRSLQDAGRHPQQQRQAPPLPIHLPQPHLAMPHKQPRDSTHQTTVDGAGGVVRAAVLVRAEEIMRTIDIFELVRQEKRRHIAAAMQLVLFPSGTRIITEGEHGDAFFIIDSGQVKVTQAAGGDVDGQATALVTLGRGDYFGELALLQNERRAASVRALASCICATLAQGTAVSCRPRRPATACTDTTRRVRTQCTAHEGPVQAFKLSREKFASIIGPMIAMIRWKKWATTAASASSSSHSDEQWRGSLGPGVLTRAERFQAQQDELAQQHATRAGQDQDWRSLAGRGLVKGRSTQVHRGLGLVVPDGNDAAATAASNSRSGASTSSSSCSPSSSSSSAAGFSSLETAAPLFRGS
jgi:hypothetical protein